MEEIRYAALTEEELSLLQTDASPAIEKLLKRYCPLVIPKLPFALELRYPIVLDSGMRLLIHPETVLRMKAGCGGCMARNRHLADGRFAETDVEGGDSDICLEGGIWEGAARGVPSEDPDETMRQMSKHLVGVLFFSHAQGITVRNATIRRGEQYGILLVGCHHFHVSDIFFEDHRKDGVHVNGFSEYGLIENLRGTCGDDFVALNAWDWDTSAVSFGAIRHMLIKNIHCDHDEMRLLPGRKTYASGKQTECPIEDCRFENISGVYNYKLYQQPNCHNSTRAVKDFSDIAGIIRSVTFSNIALDALTSEGLADVQLQGVFEIGADAENLLFENVRSDDSAEHFKKQNMTLVTVGPKSSTWVRGNPDPATWCELFEPDLIVTADRLRFCNVLLNGQPCREEDVLVKECHLSVNPDYPNSIPRGGTGYGILKNMEIL